MKSLLLLSPLFLTAAHGSFILHVDNASAFPSGLNLVASESAGDYNNGVDPSAANNTPSMARSATNGTGLEYTIFNRNIVGSVDNASILSSAMGTIAGLYADTNASLDIESTVSQGGASLGPGIFGADSSGAGNIGTHNDLASRNAAVFDFGGAVHGFSADFLDFESSLNQEGFIVLGLNGNIVFSQDILYANNADGDGEVHNIGVIASGGMAFDTAVVILGDDNDTDLTDGYGGAEFWALGNVQVGAIPEPSSATLFLMGAIAALTQRKRR